MNASYADQFLLRSDRILFSILRKNNFEHDVFFSLAFRENDMIGLQSLLCPMIVVSKICSTPIINPSYEDYKNQISGLLSLSSLLNKNSIDEFYIYDVIRLNLLLKVNEYIDLNKKTEATQLIKLLDTYANDNKYPYSSENIKTVATFVRNKIAP